MAASRSAAIPSLSWTTISRRIFSIPIRGTNAYVRSSHLAFSPVVLHEAAGQGHHQVGIVNGGQQIALADVRAGGTADVDLPPAAVDGDDTHVLAERLGAVAGAAGDGELQLGR